MSSDPTSSVGPNPPRWTGKAVEKCNIEGYLLPWMAGRPIPVRVNGCEDYFLPIYSTPEKLKQSVEYLISHGFIDSLPYTIKKVEGQVEFLISIFAGGLRVMVDPDIINENHTRWQEIVWDGEEHKLMGGQS